MHIFAINGNARAGKDSFTERVQLALGADKVRTISTIDPVKAYYKSIGWDGNKSDPAQRKVLNIIKLMWVLGHIQIDGCSTPYEWVFRLCKGYEEQGFSCIFVMVREFGEMMKITEIGNKHFSGGHTIRVVRDGLVVPPVELEFIQSHPMDYRYDYTVVNLTTLDPEIPLLKAAAESFSCIVHNGIYGKDPLVWNTYTQNFARTKLGVQIY